MFSQLKDLKKNLDKAAAIADQFGIQIPIPGGSNARPAANDPSPSGQHPMQPAAQAATIGHGRRKAVLVGINYFGTKAELRGCINDVRNVHAFLTQRGFTDCLVLTDDQQDASRRPTRSNMLQAMRWLLQGAQPGDSLFLHYSGHGGQQKDTDGDEKDGMDETLCPEDYTSAGVITDDELFELLVQPLPQGARLTAIFDCCHSGSAIDLPFMYLGDGSEHQMPCKKFASHFFEAGVSYLRGNRGAALKSLVSGVRELASNQGLPFGGSSGGGKPNVSEEGVAQVGEKHAPGDVFYFSGCRDEQTSADAVIQGNATGAMSFALLKTLNAKPQQTYRELLANVRDILRNQYSQVPQMSTSRHVDLDVGFSI